MACGRVGKHEDAERACELEPNESFSYTALSVTYRNASQAADNAHDNQRFIHLAEEAMARSHTVQLRLGVSCRCSVRLPVRDARQSNGGAINVRQKMVPKHLLGTVVF